MQGESPARLYALVVGATLVLAGALGFFYESTFTATSQFAIPSWGSSR